VFPCFLVLFLATARAGPLTHKTSQDAWTQQRVARQLVLPKGWLSLSLAAESKLAAQQRDASGARVARQDGAVWHHSRLWLELEQGFARRISLYARLPVVHGWLRGGQAPERATLGLGDIHGGLLFQPWLGRRAALALQADLKTASGKEWTSEQDQGLLTGTGVTDLGALLRGQLRLGQALALRGLLGFVCKPPAAVGYLVEDDGQGNGWLDPGDETRLGLEAEVQLGQALSLAGELRFSHRGSYRQGRTALSWRKADMQRIPGSAGDFLDGGLALALSPGSHFEARLQGRYQLAGSDTRLFAELGLEDFSPQPGIVLGLEVTLRW